MPYIITTSAAAGSAKFYPPPIAPVPTSRRAVATLDEAREAAWQLAGWTPEAPEGVRDMRRSHGGFKEATGGTIGPLLDGTVIEVRRALYGDIMREAGLSRRDTPFMSDAQVLAAFNAEAVR